MSISVATRAGVAVTAEAAAAGIAMTAVTEGGTAVDTTPEGNDCALM